MRKWITGPIMLLVLLALLVVASSASAAGAAKDTGGGNVLPPTAKPHGYSLTQAAATTAYFNVGPKTPDTLPKNFPFVILHNGGDGTFTVKPGTMFYVPVVYVTDSPPILPGFPDVTDPQAVSDFYFSPSALGAEYIRIEVDGKVTSLEPRYAVGAETPELPDTGNKYTVAAAFLTPLAPGSHTVTISVRMTGNALGGGVFEFSLPYTVIVQK